MSQSIHQSTLHDAAEALVQKIEKVSRDLTSPVRVSVEVAGVDLLEWLAARDATTRVYWRSRDGSVELAAVGSAHSLTGNTVNDLRLAMNSIHESLSGDVSNMSYVGGVRFDPEYPQDRRDTSWHAYAGYRFVLPQLEMLRVGNRIELAVNVHPDRWFPSVPETVARLRKQPESCGTSVVNTKLANRTDTPNQELWQSQVTDLLARLEHTELAKVVLARRSRCVLSHGVDPLGLLRVLAEKTTGCTVFAFQFERDRAFIGATPERLYLRQRSRLRSEAIAGTRARGENDERDAELEFKLRNSDKEQREHNFVVRSITDSLNGMCDAVTADAEPSVLKLARVQHLKTNITGIVREQATDADLLLALHPTAAVNGHPRESAKLCIRETEPFDRGWYGGPIGRICSDITEFAVAIRSALLSPNSIDLFSGAGIVRGSNPEHEWRELEKKLDVFLQSLEHDSND